MGRILTKKDFTEMLWKNGQGVTTELFRIDHDGRMVFRVSTAAVKESGTFSDFQGYDRSLVNLGPGTMWLTHDGGHETEVGVYGVSHFDGSLKTSCRVNQATRDLNIFCAKDLYFASTIVRELGKPEFVPIPPTSNVIIYVIKGALVAHNNEKREFFAQTGEAVLREASDSVNAERWMLASASDEVCVYATVVFRKIANDAD